MKKSIKAILRDDLSTKGVEKRIDLRVYLEGRQTKFATPYAVAPAYWDKKTGRVVGNYADKNLINAYLNEKESGFERYLIQCEALRKNAELDVVREIITGKEAAKPAEKSVIMIDEIFDLYIEKLRADNRREGTIRGYLMTKKTLAKYTKVCKKRTTDELDVAFVQGLKSYLRTTLKSAENTINSKLNNLRSAIKWAIRLDYPICDPFGKGVRFLTPPKPRAVFLSKTEYETFKTKSMPTDALPSMRLIRDLFIFSCETGLRFSDVMDLKWEHLKRDDKKERYVSKYQIKNGWAGGSSPALDVGKGAVGKI